MIRRGAVELLSDGRLLDLLGEGELFGFASILAETPLGFVARAAEDTLVYRIPADAIRPVLERPAALRFVARSLSARMRLLAGPEPAAPQAIGRPVSELIRVPALVCPPGTAVQEAARRMADHGTSCVLVELGGEYGIVTDRDIRMRVLAAGAGPDTALADVMTAPARTSPRNARAPRRCWRCSITASATCPCWTPVAACSACSTTSTCSPRSTARRSGCAS